MKRMEMTCGNCCGLGTTMTWVEVSDNKLVGKKALCEQCNGRGYAEYAVFSIEEAEAILKHCGLDKEQ